MSQKRSQSRSKSKRERGKSYFRLLGYRLPVRETLWVTLALIVVGGGLLITLKTGKKLVNQDNVTAGLSVQEAEPDREVGKIQRLPSEERLLDPDLSIMQRRIYGHFAATGFERLDTLQVASNLTIGTDQAQSTFFFKRPNLVMRILEIENVLRRTDAFDGTDVWAEFVAPDGRREVKTLTGTPQATAIMDEARLGTYLWDYDTYPERFRMEPDTELDGVPHAVFRYEHPDGRVTRHFLNAETLLESRRETVLLGNELGEAVFEYSDYRISEGVAQAYQLKTYLNGELFSTVQVQSVKINTGVPSLIFQKPED